MNINIRRRKNTLWNVDIVSKKVAYTEIATKLAAFNQHKKTLLDELRNGGKPGLKSDPFDAAKSWGDLIRLAQLFFWGEITKQETMPVADLVKRLRQLARALGRAHSLANRAMQDDVGVELFRRRFAEKNISPASALLIDEDESSVATRIAGEIKEVVAGIATLETAALAAAATNDVPKKAGRPALLPRDCIQGLGRVYRNSTGSKPGLGDGPFARFVLEFLTAVGRPNFEYDSVIDAIKDAHSRWKPSAFDKKA
jgi:hypothetical protein